MQGVDRAGGSGLDRRGWVDFWIGYQPAFNGFRAIGVLSFLVYHSALLYKGTEDTGVLPGAFLWLDMFFVQSGFLITALLLEEWSRHGRISIRNFYARRVFRLVPALLAVAAATSCWLLTFAPTGLRHEAWNEVWTTVLYVNNWWRAFHPEILPLYLSHAWSLSVEEQFYFVAPFVVLGMLRLGWRPRRIAGALGALALLSAIEMAVLEHRGATLYRMYYGTDTRAQAFFIGAAVAAAAFGGLLFVRRGARLLVHGLAVVAAPFVLWLMLSAGIADRASYRGVFALASIAFAVLIVEIVQSPGGALVRLLSLAPLDYVGKITYGVYLWHWPVFLVYWQYVEGRWSMWTLMGAQILTTFVVASASWRWLEEPMLRIGHRFRASGPRPAPGAPGQRSATGRSPDRPSTVSDTT